jgi:hypothetical protein
MKNRISPPRSIAAVQSKLAVPNMKKRPSGVMEQIGPLTPKQIKQNPRANEGVRRSLYINK